MRMGERRVLASALGVLIAGMACADRRDAVYGGPIIDNHAHLLPAGTDGERRAYVDWLVRAMERAGVTQSVLGLNAKQKFHRRFGPIFDPAHDRWAEEASKKYPGKFHPGLGGFDPRRISSADYVEAGLKTGLWREIGELDLRNTFKDMMIPADAPAMMRIYGLAAKYRVPVLVHYEYGDDARAREALERAAAGNPDTVFILAHRIDVGLMKRHPNLWGEYSANPNRRGPAQPRLSAIHKDDASLLDRVVMATDVQFPPPGRAARVRAANANKPPSYEEKIESGRKELGELPLEIAEKVAYKNLSGILNPRRP